MVVGKWNYEKHDYDPHRIPGGWKCKVYSEDMDEIINCVQCGKEITFGESYTSLEIHSSVGFGYAVCEGCHNEERSRYLNGKEQNV